MFLSNRLAEVTAYLLLILGVAGCGLFGSGERSDDPPPVISQPKSVVPFETREPAAYQADFVTSGDGVESTVHFARSGGSWRFDTFSAGEPSRTIIRTDTTIYVDHASRTFAEAPSGIISADRPQLLSDLTTSLLSRFEAGKFEEIGREGSIVRYRVTSDGERNASIVTYDSAIGMVVRQESERAGGDSFVFELRRFSLEVDASAFQVPQGYRKTQWADLQTRARRN